MNLPWIQKKAWAIDLQEYQIRIALSETRNKDKGILHASSAKIESIEEEKWTTFFEKLREEDQSKCEKISLCLPETSFLIKPLPKYPYLTKKELKRALSIYQEQTLPWSTEDCLSTFYLLPGNDVRREKENRCCGFLYALERKPYQAFFEYAREYGYTIKHIGLRALIYYNRIAPIAKKCQLYLLEIFKERVRCHYFQDGVLTQYRDFPKSNPYSAQQVVDSMEESLCSYIHYFSPNTEETGSILITFCISEETEKLDDLILSLSKKLKRDCPEICFLPPLTYQETLASIAYLTSVKEG